MQEEIIEKSRLTYGQLIAGLSSEDSTRQSKENFLDILPVSTIEIIKLQNQKSNLGPVQ